MFYILLGYLALISLISAVVTVADKIRSKKSGARRVPENTLMLLGALGGAAAMLMTMVMIRHKTRHIKFMLGLPIILLFQLTVILYLLLQSGLL
ncbi:MAG: DUF1294 domain-containing protein [Clostridia bacterium]|nr:DUF1294 domain-containing protein [Clostridia bacterium]